MEPCDVDSDGDGEFTARAPRVPTISSGKPIGQNKDDRTKPPVKEDGRNDKVDINVKVVKKSGYADRR